MDELFLLNELKEASKLLEKTSTHKEVLDALATTRYDVAYRNLARANGKRFLEIQNLHFVQQNYKPQTRKFDSKKNAKSKLTPAEQEALIKNCNAFNKYCRSVGLNLRENKNLPYSSHVRVKAEKDLHLVVGEEELWLEKGNVYFQKLEDVEMLLEKGDLSVA